VIQEPIVYVVDDDPGMRKSLVWLLQSVQLRVEAYVGAQEFLTAFDPSAVGCLITDLRMPGMSGLELQRELAQRGADLPTIFITGHGDVPSAARAFRAGAFDFLEKPFSDQQLLDRVREAIGKAKAGAQDKDRRKLAIERLQRLSPREREVLIHVAQGKASKVIAAELGISINTVENHRARVLKKTEATSLPELVMMVFMAGLIDQPYTPSSVPVAT
jgi:two-component system, LuxR family, response regulator FixJ